MSRSILSRLLGIFRRSPAEDQPPPRMVEIRQSYDPVRSIEEIRLLTPYEVALKARNSRRRPPLPKVPKK